MIMDTNQSLSELTPEATISQIIEANDQAGQLLASIGLSVSEHKTETLRSVCQQRKWSEAEVLQWVKKQILSTNGKSESQIPHTSPDTNDSLTKWTQYLEEELISPNLSILDELKNSVPRIHKIHGNQYPWLKNMQWHFKEFDEMLGMYYQFERKKLFPLVSRFSNEKNSSVNHGIVQKLEKSFGIIERDQDRLMQQMATIREKGNQFENPANACSTLRIQNKNFRILFSNLKDQFDIEYHRFIPRIKKELQAKK